nr:putative ribonuclease H-like domain-containing protein [Tanacetum cinerariifolium]
MKVFTMKMEILLEPTSNTLLVGLDKFANKPVVENSKAESSQEKPKEVRKNTDAPIIEEWVSDDEDEDEEMIQPKFEQKTIKISIAKIDFVKPNKSKKKARKTIKQVKNPRQNTHRHRGNQRNWNNMMSQRLGSNFEMLNKSCYVCGSFDHLQAECHYHQKQGNPQMDLQDKGVIDSGCSRIENLVDHKVKVIRCDNGTEFKNREINQFCEMKGILRQYSIARTLQQNGVYKRRNRTLIEAARTMLADSKLPTTFWVEAADERFFIGYSINSKAFRVYNSRKRIVKENLYIRFSKSTPNAIGSGPDWLFYIDALTRTINYKPISASTWSNSFAGTKASDNADPKSSQDYGFKPSSDNGKKVNEDPRLESECKDQEKQDNVNNTDTVNAASTNRVNDVGENISIELPFDLDMPALEDIGTFDFLNEDEDDGEMDDMNNLETTI